MTITYRDMDYQSPADCALLADWYNAPSTKHLYSRFTNAEDFARSFTPAYFKRVGEAPKPGGPSRDLMVLSNGTPIGQAKFETDTPKLITKAANTAWIALIVGDHRLRRSGMGTRITKHLEQQAAKSGAQRIEIGVFEYNHRALSFFTGLGYEEFKRLPDRAWWDDRLWHDVRLRKTL